MFVCIVGWCCYFVFVLVVLVGVVWVVVVVENCWVIFVFEGEDFGFGVVFFELVIESFVEYCYGWLIVFGIFDVVDVFFCFVGDLIVVDDFVVCGVLVWGDGCVFGCGYCFGVFVMCVGELDGFVCELV